MSKRLKAYSVRERLVGVADYTIFATSAKEALAKLRRGEHDDMNDSKVHHTGHAEVRRDPGMDAYAPHSTGDEG